MKYTETGGEIPVRGNTVGKCGNFVKTQKMLYIQVLNHLILKMKDFSIFLVKFPNLFSGTVCICFLSSVYEQF